MHCTTIVLQAGARPHCQAPHIHTRCRAGLRLDSAVRQSMLIQWSAWFSFPLLWKERA